MQIDHVNMGQKRERARGRKRTRQGEQEYQHAMATWSKTIN